MAQLRACSTIKGVIAILKTPSTNKIEDMSALIKLNCPAKAINTKPNSPICASINAEAKESFLPSPARLASIVITTTFNAIKPINTLKIVDGWETKILISSFIPTVIKNSPKRISR